MFEIFTNIKNAFGTPKASNDARTAAGVSSAGETTETTKAEKANSSIAMTSTGAKFNTKLTKDDFELLKVVGKGSFGKVMQVRKKDTGEIYAMKVLKKEQLVARKQVAHTRTERKVLANIDHPFIVSLRYAFQTQAKLYMILDYFTGGELFFHLKKKGRFDEARARFYAAEIALAIACLHTKDIIYRDLKPENVLLDQEGHVRLTDFGLSKESVNGTSLTHTFCGTPEYLAPEIVRGGGYGKPVDWWSLGSLLYEMLTGLPPFYNPNLQKMYEAILKSPVNMPTHLSPEAKSLLNALLEKDHTKRLGCGKGGVEEVKAHIFFKGIDWGKLIKKQVTPPFIPNVDDGKESTQNVDQEFTNETPRDTPMMASTLQGKAAFPGFTYTGEPDPGKASPDPGSAAGTPPETLISARPG
eukprot:gb/GEZN01008722.1/.p1 GENE.gb/GEZN01008722.1/~~gb/GEZN01008722.1/.p1  ORF type:complete len:413 (+),score=72.53 gb/GEZN01008722.1/:56-1294(+)